MALIIIALLLVETRISESHSGTADSGPFAEQQRLFKLLSQDTRHLIIQELLGHHAHLMSLAELEYMTGKSQAAIKDQLETLSEAGILACYMYEPSEGKRDLPSQFYGFTERGVEILHDYSGARRKPTRFSGGMKPTRNSPTTALTAGWIFTEKSNSLQESSYTIPVWRIGS